MKNKKPTLDDAGLGSNPTVDKKERRKEWRCSFCAANENENAKDRFKYGKPTKPKKKNHR